MTLCGAIVNEVLGVGNTTMVLCSCAGLYHIRLEPVLICWCDTGYSLLGTSYRWRQSLISGNSRHQINIQAKWSHFKEGIWRSGWSVWPKHKAGQDRFIRITAIIIICWLSRALLLLFFSMLQSVLPNALLTMAPMPSQLPHACLFRRNPSALFWQLPDSYLSNTTVNESK